MRQTLTFSGVLNLALNLAKKNYLYSAFLVVLGSLVLALSAQLVIPLIPVPLTFQTPTVILLGMLFGARLGAASVLLYLLEGCLGLPVFAGMSFGIAKILGPTGGYLLSYVVGVYLSGYLVEHGFNRNVVTIFLAALISTLIIFIGGVIQLSLFIGVKNAYLHGVLPFLVTEPIKLIAVSLMAYPYLKHKKSN